MIAREFQRLTLEKKWAAVQRDGEFVGSRISGEHQVHLFTVRGLYVEVWKLIGINQIRWIEVQENESLLLEYVQKLEVS